MTIDEHHDGNIVTSLLGTDERFPGEAYEASLTWSDDNAMSLVMDHEGDKQRFDWVYLCPEQVAQLYALMKERFERPNAVLVMADRLPTPSYEFGPPPETEPSWDVSGAVDLYGAMTKRMRAASDEGE